jgi:HK97 family phage prohead protease
VTQPLLVRRFTAEHVTQTDGRTLTGRVVPYDTTADVVDMLPDGGFDAYREGFRNTAFVHEMDGPHRVRLVDGHHPDGTHGPDLAVGAAMRNLDDGLEMDFRMLTEHDAEKTRTLLDVGVAGLSVGFKPCRGGTTIDPDGTRWRTKALLLHVSLEAAGAYPDAQVLALRGDDLEAKAEADYQAYVDDLDEYLRTAQAAQAELRARLEGSPPGE